MYDMELRSRLYSVLKQGFPSFFEASIELDTKNKKAQNIFFIIQRSSHANHNWRGRFDVSVNADQLASRRANQKA